MKIKQGYIVRRVADTFVALSVGAENEGRVVRMNATGAFIWGLLAEETTEDAVVNALVEKYQIDRETAEKSAKDFIEMLRKEDLLA